MPTVISTILKTLGSVLLSMLTSLLTERFLKKTVIAILSSVAEKTTNTLDNQLLAAAKEAWELPKEEKKEEVNAP
jgi:hypothetical protein